LILDGGAMLSSQVSTVLDITVEPPCLCRTGKLEPQTIAAVLGYTIA
jgi:tRNA A37 threonylcarbamoyladenosine synthetase subunit TsaC/SUA5/YrdC